MDLMLFALSLVGESIYNPECLSNSHPSRSHGMHPSFKVATRHYSISMSKQKSFLQGCAGDAGCAKCRPDAPSLITLKWYIAKVEAKSQVKSTLRASIIKLVSAPHLQQKTGKLTIATPPARTRPSAEPAMCVGMAAAPVKGIAEVGLDGTPVPLGFRLTVPVG